jgi:hypothetical protein
MGEGCSTSGRDRPRRRDRPPCSIGDCEKPAERVTGEGVALCAAHRKRLQRLRRGDTDLPLAAPNMRGELTPLERVILTGSNFLEASAEDDAAYDRALDRFRDACSRWMRAMGWRPPQALEDVVEERELG